MHFTKRFFFLKSIFLKFTLAFIAVGLIPLLVFSYFALGTFSHNIEQFTIHNFEQLLEFASKSLDRKLVDYDKITQLMYSYNISGYGDFTRLVQLAANKKKSKDEEFQSLQWMNNFVDYILVTNSYIQNVTFVDNSLNIYYASQSSFSFNPDYFYSEQQLKRIKTNAKKLTILSSRREEYFENFHDLVLTFARNYYDWNNVDNRNILGSIFINVNLTMFEDLFNRLSFGENGRIYVIDDKGYCVFSNDQNEITTRVNWFLKQKNVFARKNFSGIIQNKDSYYIFKRVPTGNWTVVGRVYQKDILKKVNEIRDFIGILIVACIVTLALFSLIFSRGFSIPVQKIIQQMKKVEKGNLDVWVEVKSQDEIGQLAMGFNNMTHELQSYITKSYIAQIKQKEAELDALKTQIRPHFLYNTLEVIRMSAIENGDEKVADMILSLAVQLKYVIGYHREIVTLGQEIEMIKNYFYLVKIRYDDKIDLQLDIPNQLVDFGILKLTLQPIVENAVVHGIKPKEGNGRVLISGEIANGNLEISVFDDGVGMNAEILAKNNELLAGEKMGELTPEGWKNIGLKNVHDRLKINFGDDYGISISSHERIGTVVKIVMPVKREVG